MSSESTLAMAFFTSAPPSTRRVGSRAASLRFGFTLFPLGHSPRVSQNCGEVKKLGRVRPCVSTHVNCARVSSRLHRVRCA